MKICALGLRYFKCYEATELVPLFFDNQKFVGFIGENGVGKSAVLEALHSFFTNQHWIRNKTAKKGEGTSLIAPVICCKKENLPKKKFSIEELTKLEKYSKLIFKNLKEKVELESGTDEMYLSCALFQSSEVKIFDGVQIINDEDSLAKKIRDIILASFRYVYIEAEVDIDSTTDVNSKTLEFIKGSGVAGEITSILETVKVIDGGVEKKISEIINEKVIKYLDMEVIKKLQEVEKNYDYKNLKTGAISRISEKHISELATQALFNNRELTKKIKNKHIGISDMSSGQRRRALLDFVLVMISNLDEGSKKKIVLAIDEPELSVDASSRIQQLEKLSKTTEIGPSIVFTTHWYGWITQLMNGNAILIKESDQGREIIASSIQKFLEKDAQLKAPYEMRMMFDFLSSLGSWAELESDKKFVICEGITDYNFIVKHFPEYKIIPVRGVDEVIRLYKIFIDYYFRVDNKPPNVVFLIDTDPEKAANLEDIKGDNLKRISRDNSGNIKIVNNLDNYSEKYAIEDVLSPVPFLKALNGAVELLDRADKDFISKLSVVYVDQTGIRAFSLDDVKKTKFKKIYSGDFKKKVSELYSPSDGEVKNFQKLLKLF
jgi:ABC-type Mn2+/Zn2+ transport system ATPase subunit